MHFESYPLTGLKVVELGTHVAVPSASRLLADFGADVIKIEPIKGDPYRSFGDQYGTPTEENYNPFFSVHNSNKKLVSLNLNTKAGLEIMHKILEQADVFVTSVREKGLTKLGLDYNSLKDKYPNLIYYHFSGFGNKGPDATRPGFDGASFWARSGGLIDIVPEGAFPPHPSQAMGDMCSGVFIAYGILVALLGKSKGEVDSSVFLTSSLYSSAIYYMAAGIISSQQKFSKKFPQDPFLPENPFRHTYLCKDGEWIMMAAQSYNIRWKDFCRIFELQDIANDKRYMTEENARKEGVVQILVKRLNKVFLKKTSDEWGDLFLNEDIAYEKLYHFKDVSIDKQAWANDYLCSIKFMENEEVILPNSPVQANGMNKKNILPQGGVGKDSALVLSGLGYSKDDIMRLNKEGVITCSNY